MNLDVCAKHVDYLLPIFATPRDSLKRINPADAHVHLVAAQLLDRAGKPLCDLPGPH